MEGPVLGIMEAALYAGRMLSGRIGIVATGKRSKVMHEDAMRQVGLAGFSAGVVSTGTGVLELEGGDEGREGVLGRGGEAARVLVVENGADCVALGCAGMTDMKGRCEEVVGPEGARVLDGVGIGVQFLVGLVREDWNRLRVGFMGVRRRGGGGGDRIGFRWWVSLRSRC